MHLCFHDNCQVYTTRGLFRCGRIVVAAGAWTNHVLASLGVHVAMVVTQEQVTYFATNNLRDFQKDRSVSSFTYCNLTLMSVMSAIMVAIQRDMAINR